MEDTDAVFAHRGQARTQRPVDSRDIRRSLARKTFPKGRIRMKGAATRYNKYGLPIVVVAPTEIDKRWSFGMDSACDSAETFDLLYNGDVKSMASARNVPPDKYIDAARKSYTGEIRSNAAGGKVLDEESFSVSIECFEHGWPLKTDLKCWWCLHGFDTRPFPCPVFYNAGTYTITGVFCGPSCAKAWAMCGCRFANTHRVCDLITKLAYDAGYSDPKTGSNYVITAAPPRESLQMFRGPTGITIEQFREFASKNVNVNFLAPPLVIYKESLVAQVVMQSLIAASSTKMIYHKESYESLTMTIPELIASRQKEGFKIFTKLATKRLGDYFGNKKKSEGAHSSAATATAKDHHDMKK